MWWKRALSAPTLADAEYAIRKGESIGAIAPLMYAVSKAIPYLRPDEPVCELAREYGATLSSIDDVRTFKATVTPEWNNTVLGHYVINWAIVCTEVMRGYIEKKSIDSCADAVMAARIIGGYNVWDTYAEWLEGELIKRVAPLLKERAEILDFATGLKTYRGVMMLAIALGYAPSGIFEEAVQQHKVDLEEEERRRQRYSIL